MVEANIGQYAFIGDCTTAALVSIQGSIDWFCLPRFDGGACFANLVGLPENGYWKLAPLEPPTQTRRSYQQGTLILETEFTTESGAVKLVDFMPLKTRHPIMVRRIQGLKGTVRMRSELAIRFDFGSIRPWLKAFKGGLHAIAGPDCLLLHCDVDTKEQESTAVSEFDVTAGETKDFVLKWYPSHETDGAEPCDPEQAEKETRKWWREWIGRCEAKGPWERAVKRSFITLKALTYTPTGGVVAAATSSLPETLGGKRNWDYRFCWLRDSTLTLRALLLGGYREEAAAWRQWLLRAVAGDPSKLQMVYGIAGERRLKESDIPWLKGYQESRPVREGNAASEQFQLDVYGEVMNTLFLSSQAEGTLDSETWRLQLALMNFLEEAWKRPDNGIWEVRGPRRHFTHSKVMAWVAFDRAIRLVEQFEVEGPTARWKTIRDEIQEEVLARGFNKSLDCFVQYYDSEELDASVLMIPLVGFLPPTDPRVRSTTEAILRRLGTDGFVRRYNSDESVDGLPQGEGEFLLCSFWMAQNLHLIGKKEEARALFERLLDVQNDVGLLAEEYDPRTQQFLGNFPQAFSHVGLITTAMHLLDSEPDCVLAQSC